jgi:hypothetical protein
MEETANFFRLHVQVRQESRGGMLNKKILHFEK